MFFLYRFSSKGFFRAQTLQTFPPVKKEMPTYLTLQAPVYPKRSCLVVKSDISTATNDTTDSCCATEKVTVGPVRKISAPKFTLK